ALDLKAPFGFVACLWFALDALAWSAICSVRRKTTFGAIGATLTVLFVFAGWPLVLSIDRDGKVAYEFYFAVKIPLLLLALALSRRLYCSADAKRLCPVDVRPVLLPTWVRAPLPLKVALWQLWRRRRGTLALLILGPVAVGYVTAASTPL